MRRLNYIICTAALTSLLALPAAAQSRGGDSEQREQRREERGQREHRAERTASAAAQMALTANGGGRVLSVERAGGGYRVKVLKDGDVRTHFISLE